MKVKTKTGHSNWSHSRIFYILENVHYIGYVRWNWRKAVKVIENQEVKKLRPKAKVNEYLLFEGKHDGIIPVELFEKAKEMRGKRHRTKADATFRNPFSGIMYCKCGSRIGYNYYKRKGFEYGVPKLVCNNQIRCRTGSVRYDEVMKYVCDTLRDCIEDFEVRIDNNEEDSIKLHKNLISGLEKKLKDLEAKEILQWEAQYDPDPEKRLPQQIFNALNKKLLSEKEEIKEALCRALESAPRPIDYKAKKAKFTEALKALEDSEVSAQIKNQYLKEIIERIDYERPENIRITKQNAHMFQDELRKGLNFSSKPFTINITLR